MITFEKIVKKLLNKSWNVVLKSDIFDIIDPEHKKQNQSKLDKTIYNLKIKKNNCFNKIVSLCYSKRRRWKFK